MKRKTPFTSVYQILRFLFDALLPARKTCVMLDELDEETLYSLARYDGSLPYHDLRVRALVWELKYYAHPRAVALAGAFLSEELLALAQDEIGRPLLLPVPMHKSRRRQRGHNQTEVLCEAVMREVPNTFEYEPRALVRIRNTRQQQGLQKHVRLRNVEGSMQVLDPKRIKGRICIVVDDVTTTGATLAEARRALVGAGARKVHCVALAQS
jgi:ComF family protein